jgi:hypothetical protein
MLVTVSPGIPTGTVFRREGARRPVWYARYRLADGSQVQRRIGPAWTERGRPASGYFAKRTAEAWLRERLHEASHAPAQGPARSGITFADAAAEWLRFIEEDREGKPSTLVDYRSALKAHLLPAFGEQPLEEITAEQIEAGVRNLRRLPVIRAAARPRGAFATVVVPDGQTDRIPDADLV